MNKEYYIDTIVENINRYFRIFALSGIVENHQGEIEWIKPVAEYKGPAIVYNINISTENADEEIDRIIKDIKNGYIPSFWYVTPGSTPQNTVSILKQKGFQGGIPTNADEIEYGMALDLQSITELPSVNSLIEVKKVQDKEGFSHWIDVVNTALHGWNMIDVEHYFTWVSQSNLSFYVGYINDSPVSTAATIQENESSSLEFVSTLSEYRRLGFSTAVCTEALKRLKADGAKIVTLGSSPDATALYKKLGFQCYFEKELLSYMG